MSEITLNLPLPPNLANGRMHWRVKENHRKRFFAACNALYHAGRVPKAPDAPLTPVVIRPTLYLWAYSDDDNALARCKWAADWARAAGYIVDDRRPHCRFEIPEQHIDRANQRLVLTITPAHAA